MIHFRQIINSQLVINMNSLKAYVYRFQIRVYVEKETYFLKVRTFLQENILRTCN